MDYTKHDENMYAYYTKRAPVYDKIYDFENADIKGMAAVIANTLKGRRVLEVACGTGVWTRLAADCVASLTATDATPATLAEAKDKFKDCPNVSLVLADAYRLQTVPGSFDGGLAVQWFSHVPKKRYDEFFASFHGKLEKGADVVMSDSSVEAGMPNRAYPKPGEPDTYQQRRVADGSKFEIIKNFFTEAELQQIFGPRATALKIGGNSSLWWVTYTVA